MVIIKLSPKLQGRWSTSAKIAELQPVSGGRSIEGLYFVERLKEVKQGRVILSQIGDGEGLPIKIYSNNPNLPEKRFMAHLFSLRGIFPPRGINFFGVQVRKIASNL